MPDRLRLGSEIGPPVRIARRGNNSPLLGARLILGLSSAMLLEIAKIVGAFCFGGLAGAVLTEWFRKKSGRLQRIPLIERANRIVSNELRGIKLARAVAGSSTQLEEISNLREYQLTLRNTSAVHLQDVEIQFDFPAEDVQAWASRAALSKAVLLKVEAISSDAWKTAFRWKIPQLPSGDSVEFTFQAVDPPSENYEVALYKSDRVIIEKVVGEPAPRKEHDAFPRWAQMASIVALCAVVVLHFLDVNPLAKYPNLTNKIEDRGCELRITSSVQAESGGSGLPPPPRIINRLFNVGAQDCVVQSEQLGAKVPLTLVPGQLVERERMA